MGSDVSEQEQRMPYVAPLLMLCMVLGRFTQTELAISLPYAQSTDQS